MSSEPFVTFQQNWSEGVGTGGVIFWVAPNLTSTARSATIRIADQFVTVRQAEERPSSTSIAMGTSISSGTTASPAFSPPGS